uniref:Uncharacterized protein n=1 Tax=Cannabis sativa TaxID=3483 RepID=A0A803PRZ8_CANSA
MHGLISRINKTKRGLGEPLPLLPQDPMKADPNVRVLPTMEGPIILTNTVNLANPINPTNSANTINPINPAILVNLNDQPLPPRIDPPIAPRIEGPISTKNPPQSTTGTFP